MGCVRWEYNLWQLHYTKIFDSSLELILNSQELEKLEILINIY